MCQRKTPSSGELTVTVEVCLQLSGERFGLLRFSGKGFVGRVMHEHQIV